MQQLRPQEHWAASVRPVVQALAPREVWVCGEDQLCVLVRENARPGGYEISDAPGERTDLVIVSGDPNYYFVSRCLEEAMAPSIGGKHGPPAIVVAATGWPHGERDGYVDPERVPPGHRRAYARCLPDPDQVWLTAEPAAIAFSLESGGEKNGVRGAVEQRLATGDWQARFQEGFGGIAILIAGARLANNQPLADVWAQLGADPAGHQQLLRGLDLGLARSELARSRAASALAQQKASNAELRATL